MESIIPHVIEADAVTCRPIAIALSAQNATRSSRPMPCANWTKRRNKGQEIKSTETRERESEETLSSVFILRAISLFFCFSALIEQDARLKGFGAFEGGVQAQKLLVVLAAPFNARAFRA